ncbi:MAG: response regulator, partial [Methanospirillum sp.]
MKVNEEDTDCPESAQCAAVTAEIKAVRAETGQPGSSTTCHSICRCDLRTARRCADPTIGAIQTTVRTRAKPPPCLHRMRIAKVIFSITRDEHTMEGGIRVLYVDDEPGLLGIGKIFLERSGRFTVDTVTSAAAAIPLLNSKEYDAIISDYQMPGMDG